MPSAKRASRSALVALQAEIEADERLTPDVRSRLSWSLGQHREEMPRMPILVEETFAAAWRVVWGLQVGGHDLLTRCRALGELVRSLRALGMLDRVGRPMGMRRGVIPPVVRSVEQKGND